MKKFISIFLLAATFLCCSCTMAPAKGNDSDTTVNVTDTLAEETTEATTTEAVTTQAETTAPPSRFTFPEITDTTDKNAYVEGIISQLSVEELVGQMFYVRCDDFRSKYIIENYHIGGFILYADDFSEKSKDQVTAAINKYQNLADIPLLMGVNEEGGSVISASSNPQLREKPFLSPREVYANGGWEAIEADAAEKADFLLSLGINVNMAPVCDLADDPDAFMYDRSFTANVKDMCTFVNKYVTVSKEKQLGTVLKHFPGYGNLENTDTGIIKDERRYYNFTSKDFRPFTEGIKSGADCILVSHNTVTSMDSKNPASLSERVHEIIRNDLNFEGVIMTNDLSMSAIKEYTENSSAAVLAAKCGNDILCCTDIDNQYSAVMEAVNNGEISIDAVKESVRRILSWKYDLGLFNK